MSDREQDVAIAKAMGTVKLGSLCPDCTRLETCFPDVVDFNTPEGSWKILDYVRENPQSRFALRFAVELTRLTNLFLIQWDRIQDPSEKVHVVVTSLTPETIKSAAYEAAKECLE